MKPESSPKSTGGKMAVLKIFLPLYGALMALVVTVALIVYQYESAGGRELIKLNERLRLEGLEREIVLNIHSAVSDLLVLAEDDEFLEILHDGSERAVWTVTEDFISFIKRKGYYDHIRFLDLKGMERIRVNREEGAPRIVTGPDLQNKADRYYYKSILALSAGHVYMSPLDLNVEQGTIEAPHKPMIRFGTIINDRNGRPAGILVMNYLAGGFLDRMVSSGSTDLSHIYLLNSEGYILQGPVQERRWGFMFEGGQYWTFASEFPEVWERIHLERDGQVMSGGDLFTFKRVELGQPGAGDPGLVREPGYGDWHIVSRIPGGILHAEYGRIKIWLGLLVGLLAVALAGLCWLLAAIRSKNIMAEGRIRKSLVEKEALLREIHHRVKNNLQVISGMLELQAASVKDPAAVSSLHDGRNRVMSMALIHQKLYQSEDISLILMDNYVNSLVSDLLTAFGREGGQIRVRVEAQPVVLDTDTAIPLGLLVSELVTNALKYAFPGDGDEGTGEITVSFAEREDGNYVLTVSDSGVGLPDGFDPMTSGSLGLRLVHTMVDQLGGEIFLDQASGTAWTIVCPPHQGTGIAEGVSFE